jgi:hypothetical protein
MRDRTFFRYLLVITLVLAVTLSCNLVMNPINQTVGVVKTGESVATDIQSIATQVDIGAIATSIQDISTQVDFGGIATQIEGVATSGGEGLISTLMSDATEIPGVGGVKPTDIPVLKGATQINASGGEVDFVTEQSVEATAKFYQRQMPANGWQKVSETVKTDTATLVFQKGGRKATVQIDSLLITSVTITIEGQ